MKFVLLAYALFFLLLLAAMLATVWLRIRELRRRSVVQMLALVVGQNLPLVPALRAAARHEKKALRRIYQRMAVRLEAGDQVSTALGVSMLSCSGRVVGALQGAEQGGTLPTVLRDLAADTRRAPTVPAILGGPAIYSLVMLIVVPFALGALFVAVIPKFKDIFADFRTTLPAVTQSLFDPNRMGAAAAGVFGSLILLAAMLVFAVVARHFLVRVPMRLNWLNAVIDALPWYAPIVRRAVEASALSRQLPILQAGLRAGHDLAPAARQAACVDANYFARRRLQRWAEAVETGNDPLVAARRLRFPAPVLRTLTSALSGANLPAALEYLATYYRGLLVHWGRVLHSALMPAVVIVWGLVIGYIIFALFLPLVALLSSVAASVD